jgi:hypothetical protein
LFSYAKTSGQKVVGTDFLPECKSGVNQSERDEVAVAPTSSAPGDLSQGLVGANSGQAGNLPAPSQGNA